MTISLYEASVPVFVRGLGVLEHLLDKADAHAGAHGTPHDALVQARLAPDMLTLAGQVQRASDTSKFAVERVSGVASPRFPDDETTFPELRKRIASTAAWLESVDAATVDAAESRQVEFKLGPDVRHFTPKAYLLTFALPNFFFHIATAHDILRNQGVAVGKLDYLGPYA
ncbi:hypothetical protein EC912_102432 [Luteibacter rhizovicinus]|uniref:DUF1993 domain-containing protein n=1 Tax=Luteibacter rhizovicinus TaxID=242606 RepID=A0A4R3YXP3_9GAMM|nr:DUF1993 domain-containing protein [Luteibacter rhizovicinus]TCV96083.1 hypothetical protein EC912_102432 [Luteibacter rhizovicinus]